MSASSPSERKPPSSIRSSTAASIGVLRDVRIQPDLAEEHPVGGRDGLLADVHRARAAPAVGEFAQARSTAGGELPVSEPAPASSTVARHQAEPGQLLLDLVLAPAAHRLRSAAGARRPAGASPSARRVTRGRPARARSAARASGRASERGAQAAPRSAPRLPDRRT